MHSPAKKPSLRFLPVRSSFLAVLGRHHGALHELDLTREHSYTPSMKTAVSIPDEVFEKAEHLARRMKKSRSQLFSNAIEEYVDRHAPDRVTEMMDKLCAEIGTEADLFVSAASRRILERSEW
jgi:hypothetical protein